MKKLYHITSEKTAKKIEKDGFVPKQIITDFKYYSEMGSDGIYFYDTLRSVQQYAYFFANKTKETLSMITVEVPNEIVNSADKQEDGFFIKRKDLNKIKILKIESIDRISNIY